MADAPMGVRIDGTVNLKTQQARSHIWEKLYSTHSPCLAQLLAQMLSTLCQPDPPFEIVYSRELFVFPLFFLHARNVEEPLCQTLHRGHFCWLLYLLSIATL